MIARERPIPPARERALFCWSGGKDSALALHSILRERRWSVTALLTTVTEEYDRISMHGVRRALLRQQAAALGLPLEEVLIPRDASNEAYEAAMTEALTRWRSDGIRTVVFGDIFLEDLRKWREERLALAGMEGRFPLWKRDTAALARSLGTLGFKAITTCVDTQAIGGQFVGRMIDAQFLAELPPTADPCGENGEYHSFVFDGPIFTRPVAFTVGEKVLRDERFYFCDLVPTEE